MELEYVLNDVLNKALVGKERIKKANSNTIAEFVNSYVESGSATVVPTTSIDFIKSLIKKENEIKDKLGENLDLYIELKNNEQYSSTLSLYSKQILIIFDLEDILCRMVTK